MTQHNTTQTQEDRTCTCSDCRNENVFCSIHQKHERETFYAFNGKHDTIEYQNAIAEARLKDLMEA